MTEKGGNLLSIQPVEGQRGVGACYGHQPNSMIQNDPEDGCLLHVSILILDKGSRGVGSC